MSFLSLNFFVLWIIICANGRWQATDAVIVNISIQSRPFVSWTWSRLNWVHAFRIVTPHADLLPGWPQQTVLTNCMVLDPQVTLLLNANCIFLEPFVVVPLFINFFLSLVHFLTPHITASHAIRSIHATSLVIVKLLFFQVVFVNLNFILSVFLLNFFATSCLDNFHVLKLAPLIWILPTLIDLVQCILVR